MIVRHSVHDLRDIELDTFVDSGSKEDPNELAFKKGQMLQILDKSGKWWLGRTMDGKKGSMSFLSAFFLRQFLKFFFFGYQLHPPITYDFCDRGLNLCCVLQVFGYDLGYVFRPSLF